MFALGIRYLNGWAMASHHADRDRPEWPPHPDRIFMALAAAHFETDGNEAERRALQWLEALPAPKLAVGDATRRTIVTSYVPVNDTEIARGRKDSPQALAKRLERAEKVSTLNAARDAGLALLPEHRSRQARTELSRRTSDVRTKWRDRGNANAARLSDLGCGCAPGASAGSG